MGHPFWRRASQAISYQSPVFAGVQVKILYQTDEGKAVTTNGGTIIADPSMWSGSVQWAGLGGRARVGAAFDSHKEFTAQGKTDTGWRVTGGWNFGFADIGAAYETMTYKIAAGDVDATQWGVQVAVPIGQGAIRAAYSKADDLETPTGTTDTGAKQYNIGYDYRFSKRTTVGVGYAKIDNDAFAAFTWSGLSSANTGNAVTPPAGSDVEIFFVSMIHRF